MKILVGIPVFRVKDLVRRSINSAIGFPADVLVVDNNADADIKLMLKREYEGKVYVLKHDQNLYCNGGWNSILKYGIHSGYDIIGLGSSDVILHAGWHELITARAQHGNEVWIPRIAEPTTCRSSEDVTVVESQAGYFTFLPVEAAKLVYPIPSTIRHWFGDQYMFEKLRSEGWRTVIINNMTAHHQQSAITFRVPEAQGVIAQDKIEWEKLQK
jgi:hypothetical protein